MAKAGYAKQGRGYSVFGLDAVDETQSGHGSGKVAPKQTGPLHKASSKYDDQNLADLITNGVFANGLKNVSLNAAELKTLKDEGVKVTSVGHGKYDIDQTSFNTAASRSGVKTDVAKNTDEQLAALILSGFFGINGFNNVKLTQQQVKILEAEGVKLTKNKDGSYNIDPTSFQNAANKSGVSNAEAGIVAKSPGVERFIDFFNKTYADLSAQLTALINQMNGYTANINFLSILQGNMGKSDTSGNTSFDPNHMHLSSNQISTLKNDGINVTANKDGTYKFSSAADQTKFMNDASSLGVSINKSGNHYSFNSNSVNTAMTSSTQLGQQMELKIQEIQGQIDNLKTAMASLLKTWTDAMDGAADKIGQ